MRAGEKRIVRVLAIEQGPRLRAVVLETSGHTGNVVLELSLRVLPSTIPVGQMAPRLLEPFVQLTRGLVIVTGGSGAGKSTVQAALVQAQLDRAPARVVVVDELVEYRFAGDAPVTYVPVAATPPEIEAALLLCPRILVTSLPATPAGRNRLALAATSQVVVTSLTANDGVAALQGWLSHPEVSEGLLAQALAGVVVASVEGDGREFSAAHSACYLNDTSQSDVGLRGAIRDRNWSAVANRLQQHGRGPGRLVA